MVKEFVDCLSNNDYDVIISNHIQEYSDKTIKIKEQIKVGEYDGNLMRNEIYPILINNGLYFGRKLNLCRWARLIRTEIIKRNIKYCDTRVSYGEDVNIMVPIYLDCKKIYVIDEYLYHYRQNSNSIMHSYKKICIIK